MYLIIPEGGAMHTMKWMAMVLLSLVIGSSPAGVFIMKPLAGAISATAVSINTLTAVVFVIRNSPFLNMESDCE